MTHRFIQDLQQKAKANPQRVAFPEATEEKILRAAHGVLNLGIAYPVLVGEPAGILAAAENIGLSLEGIKVVDYTDPEKVETTITEYMKSKTDLSAKSLKRMSKDPLYFALMLEQIGEADCVVAGINHSTGEVILASQTIIGMQEGISTISSVGIWAIPGYNGSEGELLVHADCAVCPAPDPHELADIAIASADTIKNLLDWEPRVALLSFSTKGSASHERVDDVVKALEIARKRRPDLLIDGELQLDAAIVPEIAGKKVKEESSVAGKANILIFPNLDAGNIGVKLVQRFAKASAFGPLLQGFAKPVSDLSRSAPLEDIIGVITMVVVTAQIK